MKRTLTVLIWLYVIVCAIALVFLPASHHDWFGISRRPHGGLLSLLLAMPWSLAMRLLHYHGVAFSTGLVAFAMAFNVFLLVSLRRQLVS